MNSVCDSVMIILVLLAKTIVTQKLAGKYTNHDEGSGNVHFYKLKKHKTTQHGMIEQSRSLNMFTGKSTKYLLSRLLNKS